LCRPIFAWKRPIAIVCFNGEVDFDGEHCYQKIVSAKELIRYLPNHLDKE